MSVQVPRADALLGEATAKIAQPGTRLSREEARAYVQFLESQGFRYAQDYVTNSRFMQALRAGDLPTEALALFWLNWSGFVMEVNSLIQCAYQRHMGFFKRHLDLLTLFAEKIADELIHPRPPGHVLIVWQQGEVFGLTREQMINYEMLPGCRAMLEWQRGLLYEGTLAEYWGRPALEAFIGHWARDFRLSLLRAGYTPEQLVYFQTHEDADLAVHEEGVIAHGEFNKAVCQRILEEGLTYTRPGMSMEYCQRTGASLFGLMMDSVYTEWQRQAGTRA